MLQLITTCYQVVRVPKHPP